MKIQEMSPGVYSVTTTLAGCDFGIDKYFNTKYFKLNEDTKIYGAKLSMVGVSKEDLKIYTEDELLVVEVKEDTELYEKGFKSYYSIPKYADMKEKSFKATMKDGLLTMEIQKKNTVREYKVL